MKPLSRAREGLNDRLVWQCASLLLAYPDDRFNDRLDTVERLLDYISDPIAALLRHTVEALRVREPIAAAVDYVATFDMRRRATMYLTYRTAGDTRNRDDEMLAFAAAFREAGVDPPLAEAPDYLPAVLEFAATVAPVSGRRLLTQHRVPIDMLCGALARANSPYAHTIAAVCSTLPVVFGPTVGRA